MCTYLSKKSKSSKLVVNLQEYKKTLDKRTLSCLRDSNQDLQGSTMRYQENFCLPTPQQ